MLELNAAKEMTGSITVPPSTDLFILSSATSLAINRPLRILPYFETTDTKEWIEVLKEYCEIHAENGSFICCRKDIESDRPIPFTTLEMPLDDFIVFLILGLGKKIVIPSCLTRRINIWKERARRFGCFIEESVAMSETQIVISNLGSFAVPRGIIDLDDVHALLGLAFGLKKDVNFVLERTFVSPVRDLLTALGYEFFIRSSASQREKDPLRRRLSFLKKEKKSEEANTPFVMEVLFSKALREPANILLPGDDVFAAIAIGAKSLVQRGGVIITNVPLASWACQTLNFIRRMGCLPAIQKISDSSFGAVGNIKLQRFDLVGRKVECRPLFQFRKQLPIMVVISAFAQAKSVFRGLQDLRYDHPDYIEQILACINKLGARHGEMPDGIVIDGKGKTCQYDGFDLLERYPSHCAAAFAVAGLKCLGKTLINDESILKRWPDFGRILNSVCVFKQ